MQYVTTRVLEKPIDLNTLQAKAVSLKISSQCQTGSDLL